VPVPPPEPPFEPEPPPVGTVRGVGVTGATGTVVRGTMTGVTGVTGVTDEVTGVVTDGALRVGVTTGSVDLAFARRATGRFGGTFRAGVADTVETARIPTGELADRAAGASRARTDGLVLVVAPAANAIPNAAIGAAASSSRARRDLRLAYGTLGA
jgi:hypothetical protein